MLLLLCSVDRFEDDDGDTNDDDAGPDGDDGLHQSMTGMVGTRYCKGHNQETTKLRSKLRGLGPPSWHAKPTPQPSVGVFFQQV